MRTWNNAASTVRAHYLTFGQVTPQVDGIISTNMESDDSAMTIRRRGGEQLEPFGFHKPFQ